MPSLFKSLLAVTVGLIAVAAWPLPAEAAEVDSAELILITEDTVVEDDLYVIGSRVLIRGVINGDLVAVAGQDIRIEGTVTGSVMAVGSEIVVSGEVGGSLRVSAATMNVTGMIGRDVFAAVQRAELENTAQVGGDVILWAWSASSLGSVGGDLSGNIRRVELGGEVSGDVSVSVRHIEVVEPLLVGGDFNYRSNQELIGGSNATVEGATVQQEPLPPNIRVRAVQLVGRILIAIVLSAIALLVASTWPTRTERGLDGLRTRPLASLAWGAAVMLSPLLLAGLAVGLFAIAPPAASVPLIAIMAPVIAAAMGLVLVVGVVAGIPTVAWVGTLLRRKTTIAGAVAMGSVVVAGLWLLPYVGLFVATITIVAGAGGWITGMRLSGDEQAEQPGSDHGVVVEPVS